MYYPKQVPYLLNKKFKDKVNYEEFILEELNEYCMCIWKMQSKEDLVETIYNNILPDACIDIVIDFTCKTICIAGFSKETMPLELKGKVDYMGVRLKPSGFYSLFHIEAYKVMDKQVPLLEIEKPKEQTVIDIAEKLGYNQRHLFRIFKINYGLSPKVLLNILRLHLCLTLLLEKNMDLTSIAILCGFYDQSHFIRDIKKYTGVSPLKLLENYKM